LPKQNTIVIEIASVTFNYNSLQY